MREAPPVRSPARWRLTLAAAAVALCLAACSADHGEPSVPAGPLPSGPLQALVEGIPQRTGAPGAILAVSSRDETWIGTAGWEGLGPGQPMRDDRRFRAASLTKMFVGVVVLQLVEEGRLRLDDRLARFFPGFPGADRITIDMLLSHTGGVTTDWLDDADLQARVLADLSRVWTPGEVVDLMAERPPLGEPGTTGMQYSNTDFVLLGEIASRITGSTIADLLAARIIEPLHLDRTTYQFDVPPDLVSGFYEFGGSLLDMSLVPQQSVLSFAGAAGALHTDVRDILSFVRSLLSTPALLAEPSIERMQRPAERGSWYGRALMRFCPCRGRPEDRDAEGFGHGGNLPGYWSMVAYFPGDDLAVAVVLDRDVVNGVAIERTDLEAIVAGAIESVRTARAP